MTKKNPEPQSYAKPDQLQIRGNQIFSPVRNKWLPLTPEERVRQDYLFILTREYGYSIDQIAEEESVTGRGSAQARADFLIWRSVQERMDNCPAIIVVECKSDNVTISPKDYFQGDNYARREGAKFFVTHNNRETRYWRVRTDRRPGYLEEIENIPRADASDEEIKKLIGRLKIFKENEFADLLHQCHNAIRNREHLDPAAAFDEIAKVLFVKTHIERDMKEKRRQQNRFTVDYLRTLPGRDPLSLLFTDTKDAYQADAIFTESDKINLKPATGEEIVKLLERYNLSDTSEDVKGIAFERFLGRTFRGEIGQFFTPRTIVEFMVHMVNPQEGDVICDPASGSGGFLIHFFEIVREQIMSDVDQQYQNYVAVLKCKKLSKSKMAELLHDKFEELQTTIDQRNRDSRLWRLANRCIYGCDANDRMARTSKMNMIMHGDGHGGVHHHNGFINVNGIFEGRFDIILTNPPFGANVESSDKVTTSDVRTTDEQHRRYTQWYGQAYKDAQERVQQAIKANAAIASLFDLPYGGDKSQNGQKKLGKIKTEILFLERCLALLKPGGRLGIVLPEGIFNNPSLAYVREFCEDRAFIRAVVSLPQETFYSAGASVKASLLFMQKFSEEEAIDYQDKRRKAIAEVDARYQPEIEAETARITRIIEEAAENIKKAKPPTQVECKKMSIQEIQSAVDLAKIATKRIPEWKSQISEAKQALRAYQKKMADIKTREARQLLKERFDYPVFLYDAQHVGITATGEQDVCELYHSETLGLPTDFKPENTALENYRLFCKDPEPLMLSNGNEGG
jgi:type I restriction enzyme M protein